MSGPADGCASFASPTFEIHVQEVKLVKMSQRIYFLVHGRVQGVNFRYFTQKKATEAKITGWCRNTENDQVEGEAQGDESALKQFLKDIDNGPPAAKVMKVDKEDREVQDGETQFEVRR